ncbi:hypothetical protein ACFVZN_04400 [Streptomyces virginiae]|uniref:hypothetical protein n=1 Tax=Streptomyces virginiae TaxID=1961 RepID=UPI003695DE68
MPTASKSPHGAVSPAKSAKHGRKPTLAKRTLATAAESQASVERWAERHRVDAARRLAEAEDLPDAVAAETTRDNAVDAHAKSWRVWTRFCSATGPAEHTEPWCV